MDSKAQWGAAIPHVHKVYDFVRNEKTWMYVIKCMLELRSYACESNTLTLDNLILIQNLKLSNK
jgi:hypothetical protein